MPRKKKDAEETPVTAIKPEAKKASAYGWQAVRNKAKFTKPK